MPPIGSSRNSNGYPSPSGDREEIGGTVGLGGIGRAGGLLLRPCLDTGGQCYLGVAVAVAALEDAAVPVVDACHTGDHLSPTLSYPSPSSSQQASRLCALQHSSW